jgi:ankyrin repeat protein
VELVKEFCEAAAAGNLVEVRNLLDLNRELIDARDDYAPGLYWAVLLGRKEVVVYLLERGADPNLTSSEKLTALDIARREGQKATLPEIKETYKELGEILRAYGGTPSKAKVTK